MDLMVAKKKGHTICIENARRGRILFGISYWCQLEKLGHDQLRAHPISFSLLQSPSRKRRIWKTPFQWDGNHDLQIWRITIPWEILTQTQNYIVKPSSMIWSVVKSFKLYLRSLIGLKYDTFFFKFS